MAIALVTTAVVSSHYIACGDSHPSVMEVGIRKAVLSYTTEELAQLVNNDFYLNNTLTKYPLPCLPFTEDMAKVALRLFQDPELSDVKKIIDESIGEVIQNIDHVSGAVGISMLEKAVIFHGLCNWRGRYTLSSDQNFKLQSRDYLWLFVTAASVINVYLKGREIPIPTYTWWSGKEDAPPIHLNLAPTKLPYCMSSTAVGLTYAGAGLLSASAMAGGFAWYNYLVHGNSSPNVSLSGMTIPTVLGLASGLLMRFAPEIAVKFS
ncbi:MAG: hypothetical protein LBJ92_02240 [Holosporales bacterium]|nr:hypothetical protein [Holosporales bacterium]